MYTRPQFGLNPWRMVQRRLKVTNYGTVTCWHDYRADKSVPYGPTQIAIGSAETFYTVNWMGLLLLAIAFALLYIPTRTQV
jgi:hypothetical protein